MILYYSLLIFSDNLKLLPKIIICVLFFECIIFLDIEFTISRHEFWCVLFLHVVLTCVCYNRERKFTCIKLYIKGNVILRRICTSNTIYNDLC